MVSMNIMKLIEIFFYLAEKMFIGYSTAFITGKIYGLI